MKTTFFTTARLTGLFYLGLAITGIMAFLFARAKLYVADDALATTANFAAKQGLARFGIAAELALVAFQALASLWFFKLFRKTDDFMAGVLATFGTINAILVLVATAFWLSAFYAAISSGLTNQADTVMWLFKMHESMWIVGKLFFGLWLIPMGTLTIAAKMSKWLGWTLVAGGIGYIVSVFLQILAPELPKSVVENLTILASVGEFWMIGYLLIKKVKS